MHAVASRASLRFTGRPDQGGDTVRSYRLLCYGGRSESGVFVCGGAFRWRWPGSRSAFPATVHWPDVLWRRSPAWPPPHRACDSTQERNDQENMSSYCRSSWRSASLATPETVPVNFPVAAKKTGLLRASANTGTTVSVNLRTPDASLKRPVPPVI
jgi:hypothetical protein